MTLRRGALAFRDIESHAQQDLHSLRESGFRCLDHQCLDHWCAVKKKIVVAQDGALGHTWDSTDTNSDFSPSTMTHWDLLIKNELIQQISWGVEAIMLKIVSSRVTYEEQCQMPSQSPVLRHPSSTGGPTEWWGIGSCRNGFHKICVVRV